MQERDRAGNRGGKITGNSEFQVLHIDVESRKSLKFSQVFDLCDVVQRETKDIHNLIRDVNEIWINSEWIVILSDPLVYVFLRDWSFYKKLEFYGRGPGETTMPSNIYGITIYLLYSAE
ncbi:MAG: 6-bladed beta-propeller [Bacteroidota bacterium]